MRWCWLLVGECAALLVFGCGLVAPFDHGLLTGGAGGAGGTGGAGTGASAGGSGQCADPEVDCEAPSSQCMIAKCDDNGQCTTEPVEDGSTSADVVGDCSKSVCQGGELAPQDDDSDVPQGLGDCMIAACSMGMPAPMEEAAMGTPCDEGAGKVCDGKGNCVGCVVDENCTSPEVCDVPTNTCAVPGCLDNVKNGTETDVDCGGPSCPPCDDGADCKVAGDCKGGACKNLVCADDCVCAGCTAGAPCKNCPGSGDVTYKDPDTGHCYAFFDSSETWDDARVKCQSWMPGGDLAAPSTAAEMVEVTTSQIVTAFAGGNTDARCWIGGNDKVTEGQYAWSNGETWIDEAAGGPPWGANEPTGEGGTYAEDCIVIALNPPNMTIMKDRKCWDPFPYLCERP